MKKISLTIADPCSENWDQMSASEKGRFCSNCRKTVIDFRGMSDRKLAEFFKNPPGMVCGRFYQDQLERPIPLPRKRIPWLRYFFTISLPALVLLLKSCGQKSIIGKIIPAIEKCQKKMELQGDIAVYPTDTMVIQKKRPAGDKILLSETVKEEGLIDPVLQQPSADTISEPITVKESLPMDTVTIIHYPPIKLGKIIMGGISSVVTRYEINTSNIHEIKKSVPDPELYIYPNPVNAGSLVTLSLNEGMQMPEMVEIFSGAGQLISSIRQNPSVQATVFNLTIPSATTPGIYFIRLTHRVWQKPLTQKIIVR